MERREVVREGVEALEYTAEEAEEGLTRALGLGHAMAELLVPRKFNQIVR